MVDVRPAHALHTLNLAGLVPGASDFVELLRAGRHAALSETSGLARCHGAADELQNGCVQKTGCLKVILERTMASVPNWSEMRHSAPRPRNFNDSAAADCLVKKPS